LLWELAREKRRHKEITDLFIFFVVSCRCFVHINVYEQKIDVVNVITAPEDEQKKEKLHEQEVQQEEENRQSS